MTPDSDGLLEVVCMVDCGICERLAGTGKVLRQVDGEDILKWLTGAYASNMPAVAGLLFGLISDLQCKHLDLLTRSGGKSGYCAC